MSKKCLLCDSQLQMNDTYPYDVTFDCKGCNNFHMNYDGFHIRSIVFRTLNYNIINLFDQQKTLIEINPCSIRKYNIIYLSLIDWNYSNKDLETQINMVLTFI